HHDEAFARVSGLHQRDAERGSQGPVFVDVCDTNHEVGPGIDPVVEEGLRFARGIRQVERYRARGERGHLRADELEDDRSPVNLYRGGRVDFGQRRQRRGQVHRRGLELALGGAFGELVDNGDFGVDGPDDEVIARRFARIAYVRALVDLRVAALSDV